jgi:uncharacterized protein with HEPN domain
MQPEAKKYLHDVQLACARLAEFTAGRTFDDYRADPMVRAAVERQFEIIGEALNRLSQQAPQVADRITDSRRIIAFRNLLIHGYAEIDDRVVWGVVEAKLEALISEVQGLLEDR